MAGEIPSRPPYGLTIVLPGTPEHTEVLSVDFENVGIAVEALFKVLLPEERIHICRQYCKYCGQARGECIYEK